MSALVCFHLFAQPALRKMAGFSNFELPQIDVKLTSSIRLDPERPEYHRAVAHWNHTQHCFDAQSTGNQLSSRLLSMRSANVLLILPRGEHTMAKGEFVKAIIIGELQ